SPFLVGTSEPASTRGQTALFSQLRLLVKKTLYLGPKIPTLRLCASKSDQSVTSPLKKRPPESRNAIASRSNSARCASVFHHHSKLYSRAGMPAPCSS